MPNWPYTHTVKLLSMKTRFLLKRKVIRFYVKYISKLYLTDARDRQVSKAILKTQESRFETFYLTNLTASSSSTVKVEVTFKKTMSKEFAAKSPATFFTSLTVRVICAVAEKYFWTEPVRKYLVASAASKMSSRS